MNASALSIDFPSDLESINHRINEIRPIAYGESRNFLDGAVSYLSPYISRGVISTKEVLIAALDKGIEPSKMEKFIQELAWRDYWQQIWIERGNEIDQDLKRKQEKVSNYGIARNILNTNTGIRAIDKGIQTLYDTGYMHNHLRMYTASIACNIAQSHWNIPAKWMYYHLLDADWASNALSWQWVAGSNSNKKYFANQENINKYCADDQKGTFLDIEYEQFEGLEIPSELADITEPEFSTTLPKSEEFKIDPKLPILIYNFYNLDPKWKKEMNANRILLLEPSHFRKYPISQKTIDFILDLRKNIPGIRVFSGEFDELMKKYPSSAAFFKEHPTNRHYSGKEESRDWLFSVKGYFPSFFAFWKQCKREI